MSRASAVACSARSPRRRTSPHGGPGPTAPLRPRRRRLRRRLPRRRGDSCHRGRSGPSGQDGVDDRPQPALALAVEPDQQRHRDRGRRKVAGRDQYRRHVLRDVGDPSDEVDQQGRQEDEPGDEDRQELPPRAGGCDQPAPDDHDRRHRRKSHAAVQPGGAWIDVNSDVEKRRLRLVAPTARIATAARSTRDVSRPLG